MIVTICDGIGVCPPFRKEGKWVKKTGFPDDECLDKCSSYFEFNCTSKEYNISISSGRVTPPIDQNVSHCDVSFKAVSG